MMDMKVIDLLQCLLWGLSAFLPIVFGIIFGEAESKNASPSGFIAIFFQIVFGIACYKAGGGFK